MRCLFFLYLLKFFFKDVSDTAIASHSSLNRFPVLLSPRRLCRSRCEFFPCMALCLYCVCVCVCVSLCVCVSVSVCELPQLLSSKESACNTGEEGLIPGLGRSPGGGNGNPLQYSCLGISWTRRPGGPRSMGLQRVGQG